MLTDAKLKAARPRERAYKLGDTNQLYLYATPAGGRLWRLDYTFGKGSSGRPA